MKKISIRVLAAVFATATLFVACNGTQENKEAATRTEATEQTHDHGAAAGAEVVKQAEAAITGTYPDTAVNGTAKFVTNEDGTVTLNLSISIPARANKSVAVHVHEHGDCGDHGNASHGHWNPTGDPHGKWGSDKGFHLGDIGNVELDTQGNGTLEIKETGLWSLGGKAETSLLGKAIIVHGGVDDYTTQPTGNAGNRIGCGVIQ